MQESTVKIHERYIKDCVKENDLFPFLRLCNKRIAIPWNNAYGKNSHMNSVNPGYVTNMKNGNLNWERLVRYNELNLNQRLEIYTDTKINCCTQPSNTISFISKLLIASALIH